MILDYNPVCHILYELYSFIYFHKECSKTCMNSLRDRYKWKKTLIFKTLALRLLGLDAFQRKKSEAHFFLCWLSQISHGVILISICIHPALFPCLLVPLHTLPMFHVSPAKPNALGIPCLGCANSWKQLIQCTSFFHK